MTRRREILVGLVIVAGVLVAVLGTLWLQDASFGRGTRELEGLFLEVGQLMEGNSVKLRGVTIGRIQAITVEPDGAAVRVRMRVREDVTLPANAAALSAPESMFGDWQVEIVNSSDYPQFAFLQPGDTDVMGGYALPDFSRLTAAADQISENLGVLTDRVEEAFTEETAQNLSQTIDNLQLVSERLRQLVEAQAGAFADLASEFGTSAADIGDAARAANQTFLRAEEILGSPSTDSLLLDARATLSNLKTLSEEMSVATSGAQGMISRADSTFTRLDRLTARIEAGEGALGFLMRDSTLVVQARDVLESLTSLLEDLQENPQRYVRLSIF
jgi:phospholipid/cholesterol/gamma-HCH transport system substrate-binding protein